MCGKSRALRSRRSLFRLQGAGRRAARQYWTGLFPVTDNGRDGFAGTAPVGYILPGRTGAYDMIDNVWEWTDMPFSSAAPRATIKGGSYFCSENYCQRYRAAAMADMETNFSTTHIGFRIVWDVN